MVQSTRRQAHAPVHATDYITRLDGAETLFRQAQKKQPGSLGGGDALAYVKKIKRILSEALYDSELSAEERVQVVRNGIQRMKKGTSTVVGSRGAIQAIEEIERDLKRFEITDDGLARDIAILRAACDKAFSKMSRPSGVVAPVTERERERIAALAVLRQFVESQSGPLTERDIPSALEWVQGRIGKFVFTGTAETLENAIRSGNLTEVEQPAGPSSEEEPQVAHKLEWLVSRSKPKVRMYKIVRYAEQQLGVWVGKQPRERWSGMAREQMEEWTSMLEGAGQWLSLMGYSYADRPGRARQGIASFVKSVEVLLKFAEASVETTQAMPVADPVVGYSNDLIKNFSKIVLAAEAHGLAAALRFVIVMGALEHSPR